MANLDLRALLDDWEIALKAQRKSPKTLIVYTFGVNAFLDWCAAAGRDQALTKDNVNAWIAEKGRFAAPEFLVLGAPEPWTPVDSLLWAKTMGLWLSMNWRQELAR